MYVDWDLLHLSLLVFVYYIYLKFLHAGIGHNNSFKSFVPVCKKGTWHKESELILEPPNYVIIIAYRFTYNKAIWGIW